ncbi:10 kDa chaperonin, mitochondrial-like [Tasmannia lanceolata]|uniref:10 kDa chaperonin, mitochondrial-like n=1 Tax=Tasmannia lanceolata TaxID=3420 RepID=UPI004064BFB7
MAKRLIPALNWVLVEKIVPPSKTSAGILLPEITSKSNSKKIEVELNTGKVVAVGPGARDRDGNPIPVTFKEGDSVLLPEYVRSEVKLGDKEYHLYKDDDILGTLHY